MADAQGLHSDTFEGVGDDSYYAYAGGISNNPPMVTGADYDLSDITVTGNDNSAHWHLAFVVLAVIGAVALLNRFGVRGISAA
jgi:hypothetical protein